MHQLTEAPMLTPQQYEVFFGKLADVLNNMTIPRDSSTEILRAVRNQCAQAGTPVGQNPITFILRCLLLQHRENILNPDISQDADELAKNFHAIVTMLLDNARAKLANQEKKMLQQWLLGKA